MGNRKVVENYYCDVSNIVDMVTKLIGAYRLLIGGAAELNVIALAHKKEVRDAIKRANKMGDIIDRILKDFHDLGYGYMDYCKLKAELLKCQLEVSYIQTEIDNELKLKD